MAVAAVPCYSRNKHHRRHHRRRSVCRQHELAPEKIFLDVGSNRGDVIQAFFDQKHPPNSNNAEWKFAIPGYDPSEWHVIGFEASPRQATVLEGLQQKYSTQSLEFKFPVAVWNVSGEVLHLGVDDTTTGKWAGSKFSEWGSTLFANLTGTTVAVETFDFGAFLLQRVACPKQDTVYLKMNIEGAEFVVMKDLMRRALICLFNHIDIYWHNYLMPKPEQEAAEVFVGLVKSYIQNVCEDTLIHKWSVHK